MIPTIYLPEITKNINVEKYFWRQKTQELLAQANKYVNAKLNERDIRNYNIKNRLQDHYLFADKHNAMSSMIDCADLQKWSIVEAYQ